MTGRPFQPLRADGRSRAEVIFDHVATLDAGTVLDFAQLGELLELERPDPDIIRSAVYAANRRLRREAHRSLEAVPRVGYRLLFAREHASQARRHQERARRQVRRSQEIVRATDITQLTESERRVHDAVEMLSAALVGALRYVDQRFRRHESAIEQLQFETAAAAERLSIVEVALRSAGVAMPPETIEAEAVEDTDDE